ncbi:MAG: hypothetical protein AAF204_05525 [Pseudomonadota bacterium]
MTLMSAGAFALMSGAYVYGGMQLAEYARDAQPNALLLSILAYVTGNALLLHFLKTGSYGVLMIVSALVVMVGNTLISVLFFNEEYSLMQLADIALAIMAIVCIGFGGDDGNGGAMA